MLMKDRASNETTLTQQIYETELLNKAKSSTVSMEELVQAIPTYTRVRHTLRRKRIKTRAVLPTSITAIQLTTLQQMMMEQTFQLMEHFILRLSISINFI